MTSCFLGFLTIVLIETVAGKCLGSRGKKSQEEEKLKRKKNPDKDPKTPDTVQMVERWVAGSCGILGYPGIPGFFHNPDPGILKNLIPGFFGISRSP